MCSTIGASAALFVSCPCRPRGRTVYADVAFEREKVIVELDGRRITDPRIVERRTSDAMRIPRRLGGVVYQRLHAEPEVVDGRCLPS